MHIGKSDIAMILEMLLSLLIVTKIANTKKEMSCALCFIYIHDQKLKMEKFERNIKKEQLGNWLTAQIYIHV